MDNASIPVAPAAAPVSQSDSRKRALVDILYLLVSLWLYAVSLFYPLAGFVLGIVLTSWAGAEETRRIGRTCLILGVINLVLILLAVSAAIALSGLVTRLPFNYWEGT